MSDAASILSPLAIPQAVKADAWDAFTQAKDENEIATRLGALNIPQEAKAQLWDLKHAASAPNPNQAILDAQKAKFPTKAEGGSPDLPWYAGYLGGASTGSAATPANAMDLVAGVDPVTLWNRLTGAAATVINPLLPAGGVKNPKASLPPMNPQQDIGAKAATLGAVADAVDPKTVSNAWDRIKSAIPSTTRADIAFDKIRTAAKDVPVDLQDAYKVIQRAKELEASAHGPISLGMTKVEQALQPMRVGEEGLVVNPPAMKYPQSFDIASAAKSPSVLEKTGQTGMMQAQVKEFAKALQTANREAAAKVGMGDVFDQAMKEYHQGKNLEDAMAVAKKYAIRTALGLVGLKGLEQLAPKLAPKLFP